MAFFKHIFSQTPSRTYLDFASSTPIDRAMLATIPKIPDAVLQANPSALHKEGVAAKGVLSDARTLVAKILEVQNEEIIFTSGATESDSLALVGCVSHAIKQGIAPQSVLVYQSMFEHAAVAESVSHLSKLGVQTKKLEMNEGVIEPKDIVVPYGVRFVLVSVLYVHNEIGTVQPIQEIAKRIRFLRKHNPDIQIVLHVDATQAPLHFALRIPSLGIDMMTLGATKLYCPKGVGMLYVKNSVGIAPVMFGGGQERGIRPGTQAIELIHTFAHALAYAQRNRVEHTKHIEDLQAYFESAITTHCPSVQVTAKEKERTPHITHVAVPAMDSELLVLEFDARGVAVSAKSACRNEEDIESQIVVDMHGANVGAVRFSFGRTTTHADIDTAVRAFVSILKKYKTI